MFNPVEKIHTSIPSSIFILVHSSVKLVDSFFKNKNGLTLVFGADLAIRSEGGQDACDCPRGWEHVCCLPGSRQKDVHPKCEEVTKSTVGLREAERVILGVFSPHPKQTFFKINAFLKVVCPVSRCEVSLCSKPGSSSDWRSYKTLPGQIQPLHPTFCSLLCLPVTAFSAADP